MHICYDLLIHVGQLIYFLLKIKFSQPKKNLELFLLPVFCVEFLVGLGFWGIYDALSYLFVLFEESGKFHRKRNGLLRPILAKERQKYHMYFGYLVLF